MTELIALVLGIATGAFVRANININITHKQDVDKPTDDGYNRSVGDRDTTLFLDRQYGGDE